MKAFFQLAIVASLFIFLMPAAEAQKGLSEGHIEYEITNIESESMEAQMMKGTMINIFFNKTNSKMNVQMMGGMITMDVITETASEGTTMLMNMMGRKVQVEQTKEEKEAEQVEKVIPEFDITYDKSDKKEIAGENCIKAILKDKKTNESIIMYVARKLTPNLKMAQEMFPGLEGLPMEIIINSQGMGVTITAQNFNKSCDASSFEIPEGYEKMTPEQFQKEMGGMGNFGF